MIDLIKTKKQQQQNRNKNLDETLVKSKRVKINSPYLVLNSYNITTVVLLKH